MGFCHKAPYFTPILPSKVHGMKNASSPTCSALILPPFFVYSKFLSPSLPGEASTLPIESSLSPWQPSPNRKWNSFKIMATRWVTFTNMHLCILYCLLDTCKVTWGQYTSTKACWSVFSSSGVTVKSLSGSDLEYETSLMATRWTSLCCQALFLQKNTSARTQKDQPSLVPPKPRSISRS